MMSSPTFRELLKSPVHFLAFGFGSGLSPVAPGTFGTLVAIPIYWILLQGVSWPVYGVALTLICLAGVWICDATARDLGVHDHPGIVWDEVAGYLLTMMFAPPGFVPAVLGFVLFRLFDIWKPWPISWADKRVSGGAGIMLDDLIAGLFAGASLFLLLPFL